MMKRVIALLIAVIVSVSAFSCTFSVSAAEVNTVKTSAEKSQKTKKAKKKKKVVKLKAIKGFKVAGKSTTYVKLQWKKSKEASRYLIYRKAGNQKYQLQTTLYDEKRTSYVDSNVKTGTVYRYKIHAARYNKGKVLKSKPKTSFVYINMVATSEFKVTSASVAQVGLSWKKINGATSYEIYRKSAGVAYTKIATTKSLYYVDNSVTASTQYEYAVRGYRVAKNVARYSPFKYVTARAGTLAGISGVKVKSCVSRALLTWTAVSGVSGYDIYWCNSSGTEYYKSTVTKTMYLSPRLTAGTNTFKIKAYKNYNGKKVYTHSQTVKANIVSTAYGKTVGSSYIEVCTETQAVYMYVNNTLVASTPVVTGKYGVFDTTPGFHKIISRKSPATLRGSAGGDSWVTPVSFWLGFTYDGQGLHDSTWRTSGYGGTVYKGNGSHGCVNTPYSAMSTIYKYAYVGMPVIVY